MENNKAWSFSSLTVNVYPAADWNVGYMWQQLRSWYISCCLLERWVHVTAASQLIYLLLLIGTLGTSDSSSAVDISPAADWNGTCDSSSAVDISPAAYWNVGYMWQQLRSRLYLLLLIGTLGTCDSSSAVDISPAADWNVGYMWQQHRSWYISCFWLERQ